MTRISRIGRGGGNRFDNAIVSRRSSDSMGNTSSDFVVFSTSVNRADGISEIEGKAARVAAREEGPSAFQIRAIRGSSLCFPWCALCEVSVPPKKAQNSY